MTVSLKVVTDVFPDDFRDISKSSTELPTKFFVDYLSYQRADPTKKDFFPNNNPNSAILFDSVQDYKDGKSGKNVNLAINCKQNGINADNMVLYFTLKNNGG